MTRSVSSRRIACVVASAVLGAARALSAAEPSAPAPALAWRPLEVGFGCGAEVTNDIPRDGQASLCLHTLAQPNDTDAWMTFVRVELKRADGKPLGNLKQLADGGSLSVDFFRHPDSGEGLPVFTLPWVGLRVRNPDGEEGVLLWESAYNGWKPGDPAGVPEAVWLDDVRIDTGTFWMRYQGRNYNGGKGFQKLAAYADGSQATRLGASSLKLAPDTQVVAVEFGSGPNLPGRLLAYIDDVRLSFTNGAAYHHNFEPAP